MQSKLYRYSYTVRSTFLPHVDWHFFKLRAVPCNNGFQHVKKTCFDITPKCHFSTSCDGFGNAVQYGSFDYDHDSFTMISEGEVLQSGEYAIIARPEPFYLAETHLTACDDEMKFVARNLGKKKANDKATPLEIMHFVHNHITYKPYATDVTTTARDVFQRKEGVCQDYAHLMIALCRASGLHARYVNGLIIGEGQTHAWVEVSIDNVWHAFDPTHDREIFWDYIKIAHGRDADDCPTNRGRFYSWTNEIMTVDCKLNTI